METVTWNYFTAHGDWLKRFPWWISRTGWLSLRDNLTARCDRLEGGVAMGTQGDPVTGFGSGWCAFTSCEAWTVTPCVPPHLCFDETWEQKGRGLNVRLPHKTSAEPNLKISKAALFTTSSNFMSAYVMFLYTPKTVARLYTSSVRCAFGSSCEWAVQTKQEPTSSSCQKLRVCQYLSKWKHHIAM